MGSSSKRRRKRFYKNIITLAVVLAILGGIYFYVEIYMRDPQVATNPGIPQPEYTVLENTDSLNSAEMVIYANNVNINSVAYTFYKSNIFWPYIFLANIDQPSVKDNPLDISAGTILKIPRLSAGMIDLNNPKAIKTVEALADSIFDMKDETPTEPRPTVFSTR